MSYWCSQFRYGAILPTSFRPESHILPDNLTILYCLLNDWNHRHHIKRIMKNTLTMLPSQNIFISKFALVSWRISMLCDGVVHTMLLHILLPTKCTVTPGLSHRSVAVFGCIYNTKYKFWLTHTHTHIYTWPLYLLSRLIMTIFAQYYMYQWLQCGIKYAIDSCRIYPSPQKEAEYVTLNNSDINQR